MKNLILAIISTSLMPVMAQALKNDYQQIQTIRAARMTLELEKPEDFLSFPASAKNQKIIENEIGTKKFKNFERPEVLQDDETKLTLSWKDESVQLDFKQFDQNIISMNAVAIRLSAEKTFYNYMAEIEQILKKPRTNSRVSLLLPEALANANYVERSRYLAGWFSRFWNYRTEHLSERWAAIDAQLADIIIEAYVADAKISRGKTRSLRDTVPTIPSNQFKTLTFNCPKNKNDLLTVQEVELGKMHASPKVFSKLTLNKDGTWSQTKDGKVTRAEKNVFSSAPYFRFPKMAERCCGVDKCGEKVSQAVTEIATTFGQARSTEKGAR